MERRSEDRYAARKSKITADEEAWLDSEIEKALSRIALPEIPPVTQEEIERRREVADRILSLRERMKPLSVSTSDLIRELRGWPDDDERSDG
jgi:hypothetical protein